MYYFINAWDIWDITILQTSDSIVRAQEHGVQSTVQ